MKSGNCFSLTLSLSVFVFTGILIVNQSQQRKHQIAGDLHINAVQRNDSGRYTCAKINNNKQSQQVEIQKDIQLEIICKYILVYHLFAYKLCTKHTLSEMTSVKMKTPANVYL